MAIGCRQKKAAALQKKPVRVQTSRRGNNIVTVILTWVNPLRARKTCLASKRRLGCGGAVKEGDIEVQGDKVKQIEDF